jgi:hypothetical protein
LGDKFDQELSAILDGYIYCPGFESLNDPMEGKHEHSLALLLQGRTQERYADIEAVKSQLGVASLSEVHDHEPMWAHYAQHFRGMCVIYYVSKLLKGLPDDCDLVRMTYSEKPPILLAERATAADNAKLTLSTKTTRWMSEREWRLIAPSVGPAYYRDRSTVFRVLLGPRVTENEENTIRSALKALKIPVLKMNVDRYRISFSRDGSKVEDLD